MAISSARILADFSKLASLFNAFKFFSLRILLTEVYASDTGINLLSAFLTVTLQVAVFPFKFTVMVAVPMLLAVTQPFFTVATFELLDVQVRVLLLREPDHDNYSLQLNPCFRLLLRLDLFV